MDSIDTKMNDHQNDFAEEIGEVDSEALLENDEEMDDSTENASYFILEEWEANAERIRFMQRLETRVILRAQPGSEAKPKVSYLTVEGGYFPDCIEEDGCYLLSVPLLEYLEYKFDNVSVAPYRIALVAEDGKRIEEYSLLLPEELDCVAVENAVYNDANVLEYFELDPVKTGGREIFKVKGFPHLIVSKKLNRIEFAGVRCTRIDRYFNYGKNQSCQEQDTYTHLEQLVQKLEVAALTERDRLNVREFTKMALGKLIEYDFNRGLRHIFESFRPKPFANQEFSQDYLEFAWSWERETCELTQGKEFFGQTGFDFKYLTELKEIRAKLPQSLQVEAQMLCYYAARIAAGNSVGVMFERFRRIHADHDFRLYLREEGEHPGLPFLFFEFRGKNPATSATVAKTGNGDWNNRDLQGADFSGKNLNGFKICGSDLSRAKFHGSNLNQVEFLNCDLTGAEFNHTRLVEAKFSGCRLDRAGFEEAELKAATLDGCSLEHTRFIQSNLTGVKLNADGLFCTFFYRSRLQGMVFSVPGALTGCVFRLCDLRKAQFIGNVMVFDNNLEDCDFRSADLTDCRIATRGVAHCSFVKAKLLNADFAGCKEIIDCNFKWSFGNGMNLEGLWVLNNDFTGVDLSRLVSKKGVIFKDNDFSYANLAGYDFGSIDYSFPNRLIYTDLTQCRLQGYDLSSSYLLFPNFKEANLQETVFTKEQLKYVKLTDRQLREIILDSDEEDEEAEEE